MPDNDAPGQHDGDEPRSAPEHRLPRFVPSDVRERELKALGIAPAVLPGQSREMLGRDRAARLAELVAEARILFVWDGTGSRKLARLRKARKQLAGP
jgi:hypothetical protein